MTFCWRGQLRTYAGYLPPTLRRRRLNYAKPTQRRLGRWNAVRVEEAPGRDSTQAKIGYMDETGQICYSSLDVIKRDSECHLIIWRAVEKRFDGLSTGKSTTSLWLVCSNIPLPCVYMMIALAWSAAVGRVRHWIASSQKRQINLCRNFKTRRRQTRLFATYTRRNFRLNYTIIELSMHVQWWLRYRFWVLTNCSLSGLSVGLQWLRTVHCRICAQLRDDTDEGPDFNSTRFEYSGPNWETLSLYTVWKFAARVQPTLRISYGGNMNLCRNRAQF